MGKGDKDNKPPPSVIAQNPTKKWHGEMFMRFFDDKTSTSDLLATFVWTLDQTLLNEMKPCRG